MKDALIVIRKRGRMNLRSLFFLSLSVFVPGVGLLILWSAVLSESVWSLLLGLAAGGFLVGSGVLFLRWGITVLTPAHVVIEDEKAQYFVRDPLREVIRLDERASLNPFFNNLLGRDGFYGFVIKSGGSSISLSPFEGWPLDELYDSVHRVLSTCRQRQCQVSQLWDSLPVSFAKESSK